MEEAVLQESALLRLPSAGITVTHSPLIEILQQEMSAGGVPCDILTDIRAVAAARGHGMSTHVMRHTASSRRDGDRWRRVELPATIAAKMQRTSDRLLSPVQHSLGHGSCSEITIGGGAGLLQNMTVELPP